MGKYNYPYRISFSKFLFNSSAIAKNPIPFHRQFFDASGEDSFSIRTIFSPPILLTRDAELAKYILQKKHKSFEKSKLQTQHLSRYVGYGLLTSTGAKWLKQRRLIQPAFHKEKLNNLMGIINDTVKEQVSQVSTNQMLPLYPVLNVLAFEVIAKSLFNYSADKETLSRLQHIIERLQQFIVKEIRQPHKRLWYKLNGDIRTNLELVKEIRAIIHEIIETRRASKETHDDLLDMLLAARYEDGTAMENEQLIDEIIILFVAGHETTANALTFILGLLAKDDKARLKAQEESDAFDDDHISMASFASLPYIKSCIEEGMRLYPSAWITDRVALKDEILGAYKIKKGTLIGLSIYEIHRNKKYWEDPERFIPERFLGDQAKKHGAHYLPFGAGPRLCIGNNFAMFEMMLVVLRILKQYHITTDADELKISPLITLKPVGINLKFSSRTNL